MTKSRLMTKSRIHPTNCRCVRCLPKHPTSARPLLAIIAIMTTVVAVLNSALAAMLIWSAL